MPSCSARLLCTACFQPLYLRWATAASLLSAFAHLPPRTALLSMSGMSSILQALLAQNGTDRVAAFRQLTNAQTQQLLEELRQAQNTRFGPAQAPSEPAQPAQDQEWDQSAAQQRDPWDQLPGTAPVQPQHRGQGKGRRRYEDYDAMRGPAPAPRWADSHDDGNDDWGQWHGTAQSSHGQASWEQSGGDWSYAQPAGYGNPPPAPPSEPAPAPAQAPIPAAFWPLPRPRPDQPHRLLGGGARRPRPSRTRGKKAPEQGVGAS